MLAAAAVPGWLLPGSNVTSCIGIEAAAMPGPWPYRMGNSAVSWT